jgi:hypothetical protein
LGYFYYRGQGIERDYTTAIKWYNESEKQGNMVSAYNLGIIYENGDGVQKNDKIARKHFEQAETKGYAFAKSKLEYLENQDRSADELQTEDMKWYNKVIDQSHVESVYYYEELRPRVSLTSDGF